ncbi:MAG: diaminopimelate dehydrogenase [Paludibacteraceae bacterium]|jgi:diaminopimelate dehydrogenase|nr:diaminopimelate dehydrogenase [Paludibacteraceae bacterium]OQA50302.1 MAG: Meso-diaminopimelate D-dehydrogenase [Bacteroidetes bacterium ADurb.Bin302]HOH96278.1 diaminopimelate dehydrogenase [Candidatus Enterocola sp.]HPG54997.1 diaminopimelate dehydrogenase [Candidatus Enterocola sp.]
MKKIKVAIIGYGNIGKFSVEAALAAPDIELCGVVRRASSLSDNTADLAGIKVVSNIDELGKVDVAILCGPTRIVPEIAVSILKKGICTVDSYDIHGALWDLHQQLDEVAKANGVASIISAGWDPGTDSVLRTLFQAMVPKGITYTNFGPGMSMGHSVVANSKSGVKNALSMTIPLGTGIHRRMVYVELEKGASIAEVTAAIKADSYFAHDETHVIEVESVDSIKDMGHGVLLERKGVSGKTQNQRISFSMSINNPALTAQILISCARAVVKQKPGAYALPEIAPMDLLSGDRETLIKSLV